MPDECAFGRHEDDVFFFTDCYEMPCDNGTCRSELREYCTYGRTYIKAKFVLYAVLSLCLSVAAISPARHAEWFHMFSSTISSSKDRTMEMAMHINAFHLEVSYT
jgi:hypothetical protein